MHFPRLQDVNLEPLWEEEINHKLALKHSLLFSTVDDVKRCIVEETTLADALNYLSKLPLDYPVNIVDVGVVDVDAGLSEISGQLAQFPRFVFHKQ